MNIEELKKFIAEALEEDGNKPELLKVHVTSVDWDTDGEEADLPQEFDLEVEHYEDTDLDDEVSDAISDKYGFCHFGFNYINEDVDLDELGGEALETEDLEPAEEEKKIELELEIKDDKIEVEANVDNVEFEGELKPEGTLEEAPAEEIEESVNEEYSAKDFLSDIKELLIINSNLEKGGDFITGIKDIKEENDKLIVLFEDGTAKSVIVKDSKEDAILKESINEENKEYYVTYKIEGRYTVGLNENIEDIQKAISKANDIVFETEFGELEVVNSDPIYVEDEKGNRVWEDLD